jgi:uncharacterized protein YuzE
LEAKAVMPDNAFELAPVAETRDLDENTTLAIDAQANVCSITVEHASQREHPAVLIRAGRVWPRHGHRGRPLNSVVRQSNATRLLYRGRQIGPIVARSRGHFSKMGVRMQPAARRKGLALALSFCLIFVIAANAISGHVVLALGFTGVAMLVAALYGARKSPKARALLFALSFGSSAIAIYLLVVSRAVWPPVEW